MKSTPTHEIASGATDRWLHFSARDVVDVEQTGLVQADFTVYTTRNGKPAVEDASPTIEEVDATNMPGLYRYLANYNNTLDVGHAIEELVIEFAHASIVTTREIITLTSPHGDESVPVPELIINTDTDNETLTVPVYDTDGRTKKTISTYDTFTLLVAAVDGSRSKELTGGSANASGTDIDYALDVNDFKPHGLWRVVPRAQKTSGTLDYRGPMVLLKVEDQTKP